MKNYERPIVVINDDLAEGVYAASGLPTGPKGTSDCWDFEIYSVQDSNGSHQVFEIKLRHHTGMEHISSATTVSVTFSSTLSDAYAEFDSTFSGSTITITRVLLADAYNDGDWVTYKIWAKGTDEATTKALTVTDVSLSCTKSINVQGGGANEM